MKTFISLLTLCATVGLLNAQVDYYVSEYGDDSNDGLSESAPFATLLAANDAIVADEALDTIPGVYVINISGTVSAGGSSSFKTNEATEVTVKGSSPATDVIQMVDDATFAEASADFGRIFDMTNAASTNVKLIVQDLTIKNFGFIPKKSWGAGALCNQKNDYFELKGCVIKNAGSRSGTITQTMTDNTVFKMSNCYVSDLYSYIGQAGVFSPIRVRLGEATVNNCIFNSISKDFEASGYTPEADAEINNATVITVGDASGTYATKATITNNTFINCKVTAGSSISGMPQSVIMVDTINEIGVEALIANNLLIDNLADPSHVDILNLWGDIEDSIIIVNNVMNAQTGISEEDNDVNADYSYTSEEIAIPVESGMAQVFTSPEGMMYVKAEGTSVVGKADTSYTTAVDIIGTERDAEAPTIGAYEYTVNTGLKTVEDIDFAIYPNPSDGKVSIILPSTADITVYNQIGQSIVKRSSVNTLEINDLNSGVYIIKVSNSNGTKAKQLIVR